MATVSKGIQKSEDERCLFCIVRSSRCLSMWKDYPTDRIEYVLQKKIWIKWNG